MAAYIRGYSKRSQSERIIDDATTCKNASCTVTCVFLTNIAGHWRNVSILWSKNMMNISSTITVESIEEGLTSLASCKVELKPWHFWSRKGIKSFEIHDGHENNHELDVHWDLRAAKFSGNSPEPSSDYYIALTSDEELVLLLGDYKKKAYKKTKKQPASMEAIPYLKKEIVYAKKSFATRAQFAEGKGEHDIVVESSTSGPKDPEMWISIDGIVLIHVKNLQWKFRGNETVFVNKQPIHVLWDVHAWLFCSPGTSCGLFIFKPGTAEVDAEKEGSILSSNSDSSLSSAFNSNQGAQTNVVEFCLFLHAWKIE